MTQIEANGLPMVEEHEATGKVAEIYQDVKRTLGMPFVPSFIKALATSPTALSIYWSTQNILREHSTLPESLRSMILYAIAVRNECKYCSASHELNCLVLGIDEATLRTLVQDLPQLSPERIRLTIEFALNVSGSAKDLVREDYDRLRAHGVTDEELVEIIQLAALGSSGDVLADALKVEVDDVVIQALGRQ